MPMSLLRFSLAALFVAVAQAQELAPDALVKTITQDVVAILKQDKDIRAGDPKKVSLLVETKVVPHFNFTHMTRIAMARNWRLASPEQQKELTEEFKTLLVRTYSHALENYRDQEISYRPLRAAADDTEVLVRSFVRRPGAEPLSIDYEMADGLTGWKVYDVKVGGVSLVMTYRDSFAAAVRADGIDGLIKLLSDRNRLNETALPST